jgi:simple sugar transport system permease protein
VLAIACAFALPWAFARTRLLHEIALVGMNRVACAAERMPVARRVAQAMLASGAIAGLVSSATVLGYKGYFESGLGAGAGYGGIAVAMLGRGSPAGLIASALLFGTLEQGGLAINAHVPMEVMQVIEGVVIVSVALADARVRAVIARAVPRGSPT